MTDLTSLLESDNVPITPSRKPNMTGYGLQTHRSDEQEDEAELEDEVRRRFRGDEAEDETESESEMLELFESASAALRAVVAALRRRRSAAAAGGLYD